MRLFIHTKTLLFIACLSLMGLNVLAQDEAALTTAQKFLSEKTEELGLSPADVAELEVTDNYVSSHNGVTHLYFRQKHAGIPVFNGVFNINILPNGKVLNHGNRMVADLAKHVNATDPQISAADAVEALIERFEVKTDAPFELAEIENNGKTEVVFAHEGIALEPIRAKLAYQPMPDQSVRLAWQVNWFELGGMNRWNARIDAVTGEVLAHHNQVLKCDFGSPDEVCAEMHEHGHEHHLRASNASAATVVDVNNAYNVFPLGVESPNHGERELMIAPADPVASPFGWHDVDGEEGHEYTITRGNNVHAFQDVFSLDQSSGDEPDGGDSLYFDFPFSETSTAPYTQIDAAVTNLFYWNNLMHDIWYQYGFDEAAGNYQENNYGNGGVAGDYVRAQALDGGDFGITLNNAVWSSNSDGSLSTMQMFLWGNQEPPTTPGAALEVNSPASVAGSYPMFPGGFGGDLPPISDPLTAVVVLADDGVDTNSDACEDLINSAELNGKIALIDRGDCQFGFKALAAQNAGAIAVIICNNVPEPLDGPMGGGAVGNQVNIPAVMVSLTNCNTIKMGLPGLEVSLADSGDTPIPPTPGPIGIDGDFDNGIIAHEYGHGISIRLAGGPGNGNCLNGNEQPGEGWSDWFGLVLATTAENTPDQRRGIGTYATDVATTATGIRTYPYSRDMSINPHTYANINDDIGSVHFVGSVWCAMIWDLYWNLVDEYGYDDDLYNGTGGNNIAMQLVIDGIKLIPCSPNFIELRDAIIAADEANYDGANLCLIWKTFARRGLGINAQPGGVEDFTDYVLCRNSVEIEKTGPESVDIDLENTITYTLGIANGVTDDINDVVITDILPEGAAYVEGSYNCGTANEDNGVLTLTLDNVASGTIEACSYEVQVESEDFSVEQFTDSFEVGFSKWDTESATGSAEWGLDGNSNSGNFAAFATNPEEESDQYLFPEEPFIVNGNTPIVAFWHSYDTEANFDGGVVEAQVSGQTEWQDLGDFILQNGYDGNIVSASGSAISGRPAFHGNSDGYIYTRIDMSTFVGQEILIRFRFASNDSGGGTGWYVDDVQFFSNFVSVVNTACMENQDGDEICSSHETLITGTPVSSTFDTEQDVRVLLFPNPTQGMFTLQVDSGISQSVVLNIYGADGRLLKSAALNTNETQRFDLAPHGTGIYFAEIISGEMQTVRKVVVN